MKKQDKKKTGGSVIISKENILEEIKKNSPQKVVFIINDLSVSVCEILDHVRSITNTYIIVFSSEWSDAEDVFFKAMNFVEEVEDYEIYFGERGGFIEIKMNRIKKILKTQKKALKKAGK